jgi:hypothetical protein
MPEYRTDREAIPMVASTLAAAIIAQNSEIVSAEAAVALYEKVAALLYGVSPYAAPIPKSGV